MGLQVNRAASAAVVRGHPWIYRDAITRPPSAHGSDQPVGLGSVVEVADEKGRFVARGLWDPASPIAIRVFTRRPEEALGPVLFRSRLERAIAIRDAVLDEATDAYRLVNGEGDLLPGLVVDRY